tara:strand:- start:504 stop:716 length:213 start_codon:yes stop_codon:yes gene_type:complete
MSPTWSPIKPILDRTKIVCKRCRGVGKRRVSFNVEYPEEYQGDIPTYEMINCDVCNGTGEVELDVAPPRL